MHLLAVGGVSYWPFAVLAIGVVFIVVAITVLRLHAFLALILAALLVGWLSKPPRPLPVEDSFLVSTNDLLDAGSWAAQLNRRADPVSVYLMSQFTGELAEQIRAGAAAGGEPQALLKGMRNELNRIIQGGSIYDQDRFAGVTLSQDLRSRLEELPGGNARLNRLLLDAAYPEQIRKCGPSKRGVAVLEQTLNDFGRTAGGIGVVIALASIIGTCLMESGAADKIVRRFVGFFGERLGALALLVSGFVLSVPVFFDTVFFLLIPLARAMGVRTGRNFMLYVLAIGGGGALTHSIVPPTPGPLLVADQLHLDLGISIVAGLVAGLLPAVGIYFLVHWLDRRVPVPVREVAGASLADLQKIIDKKETELPSFWLSMMPVVLPVFLIALASFIGVAGNSLTSMFGPSGFDLISRVTGFLGNKVFALLLGAVISMGIYMREARLSLTSLGEKLAAPLETAGVIILITSAGGAFGAMIRHSGVGDAVRELAEGRELNLILLAWLITAVIRVAQGSATVSMITGSALMFPMMGNLDFHPLYIYLAIGFGSMILSWMNDSGFWVVSKLSGFTEKETLKTWSVVVSALSIMGLIEILVFSKLLPLV